MRSKVGANGVCLSLGLNGLHERRLHRPDDRRGPTESLALKARGDCLAVVCPEKTLVSGLAWTRCHMDLQRGWRVIGSPDPVHAGGHQIE